MTHPVGLVFDVLQRAYVTAASGPVNLSISEWHNLARRSLVETKASAAGSHSVLRQPSNLQLDRCRCELRTTETSSLDL